MRPYPHTTNSRRRQSINANKCRAHGNFNKTINASIKKINREETRKSEKELIFNTNRKQISLSVFRYNSLIKNDARVRNSRISQKFLLILPIRLFRRDFSRIASHKKEKKRKKYTADTPFGNKKI